jgi:hypothetical protein
MASKVPLRLHDDDPWIIEQKIFDIVSSFVQPDSTQKAADAVDAIDRLFPLHRTASNTGSCNAAAADAADTENARKDDDADADENSKPPESPGTFMWNLWPVFYNIAQQLQAPPPPPSSAKSGTPPAPDRVAAGVAHDRLAELVSTLGSTSSSRTPTVAMEEWDDEKVRLWQDLPLFGPTFYETWSRKMCPHSQLRPRRASKLSTSRSLCCPSAPCSSIYVVQEGFQSLLDFAFPRLIRHFEHFTVF